MVRLDTHLLQRQGLIVTPEMQFSLRLLQASSAEIIEEVKAELERNPVLEALAGVPGWSEEVGDWWGSGDGGVDAEDPQTVIERTVPANPGWRQRLLQRLRLEFNQEESARIAENIVWNLDERGFLVASAGEIGAAAGVSEAEVEEVRKRIMLLEPPGFAARNVQECLWAQLASRGQGDSLPARIVRGMLDLLARNRLSAIRARTGASDREVERAARLIRSLSPFPASGDFGEPAPAVVPDVIVEKVGDRLEVRLNDSALPRLRLRTHARASRAELGFLAPYRSRARRLIECLDARAVTLRRVAEAIVAHQREFFEKGTGSLLPLGYADIAARVGLHQSTVARAVAGKYMQTPLGTFPFRHFFSRGLESAGGRSLSPASVKSRIAEIISAEDRKHPLPDSEVRRRLRSEGVRIARRTVAKYRRELGIPPAGFRGCCGGG